MSAIDISTPKTILNTGILQLQNGVAMDATLRNVADQNNTISPLKLSTASVQVTSTLQITTNDNPYIDAEDGAGNNRFTIGRASTSQQVNVDFASNPTSATDAVGAFRTYANGVVLSEAMTFLRNGRVGIGTNAPATTLHIKGLASTAPFYVQNAANLGLFAIQDDTQIVSYASKFNIRSTGGDYGGWFQTNATQSLQITNNAYNNGTACALNLNGIGVLINSLPTNLGASARLHVLGQGSTSATTSLLVQNSSAFQLLKVTDDGQCLIGGDGLTTFPLQVYGNSGLQIQVGNSFFSYNAVRTIRFLNANNGIPLNHEVVNQVSNTDNSNYVYFRNQGIQTAGSLAQWKGISIETIVQTQSSAVATQLSITPTLDLNANTISSSIQRGIYYNPTITNLRVAKHYGIQTTSGGAYINTTTPQDSACLQADSTTQGFLPPRMTNAQRLAIVTPAVGLMVYCTDAVEGLYVYKSIGWTFVI